MAESVESVEVQRLRQMLKSARSLLRELSIACARVEEELDRNVNAQPKEGTANASKDEDRQYATYA